MFGLLPPSSRVTRLERAGGVPHDDPADLGRAGERDLVDAGVLDQGIAGRFAVAGHDVDHAGRKSCLERQLAQAQARRAASARPAS